MLHFAVVVLVCVVAQYAHCVQPRLRRQLQFIWSFAIANVLPLSLTLRLVQASSNSGAVVPTDVPVEVRIVYIFCCSVEVHCFRRFVLL